VSLSLPLDAMVPAGYIYVPPGTFLTGSDLDDLFRRDFLVAPPLRAIVSGEYLIARHEVTLGDWIEYLDALPTDERELRRPKAGDSALVQVRSGWELAFQPTSHLYRVSQGKPLEYRDRDRRSSVRWERLPVFGVDLIDARAYAMWLSNTKRVPGARLCTGDEWERAARGADGRPFPHGHEVAPDDANIDVTYGRREDGFGPDEVGSHPASDSPFGVADLFGNVWEWVEDAKPVLRGGGWYQGVSSGNLTNHDFTTETFVDTSTGVRICADAPPAR
jgi:formylglycine-generating enzyme required for sulfatase activity